jgi:mannose-1-phosphate guanylyltransferase
LIHHNSYRSILAILQNKNKLMKPKCYSVIIAGGKGTRFWPLSRSQKPKQLLKIFSAKSLIKETADRVESLGGREQTLVITVAEQVDALVQELRALPRKNFIAEPQGKNTAPCIGLAALELTTRDPAAVMVILPADHWVANNRAFCRTLKAAVALAIKHDQLITIGIRPAYPETGYGYIVRGQPLGEKGGTAAYHVKRFKEKPSIALAQQLIGQGALWNSGIFVWKASTLLALLERYQPAIALGLKTISQAAQGQSLSNPTPRLRAVMRRAYKKLPNISIDHAVLEKAGSEERVLTIQGNFGWSDVGSWAAVHRMLRQDHQGNAGNGRWLGFGAKNCFVHAPDRLVVLLGVEDALVVDTPDALLVGDLRRSQQIRDVVEELQKKGYGSYTIK